MGFLVPGPRSSVLPFIPPVNSLPTRPLGFCDRFGGGKGKVETKR